MADKDRGDEGLGELFDRRPTIRARDLDELREAHLSIFGPLKFEVKKGSRLDARIGVRPLKECALYHASYGAPLTGRQPSRTLQVSIAGKWGDPAPRLFRHQLSLLLEALEANPPLPALLLNELEQSLIVTFLFCHLHNYSQLLDQDPKSLAPWQVRRVEAFIEANWDQPLTIEAMAASVSASARSVFHWFSKARGYSPMEFLRTTRLKQAQARLAQGHPDSTVTEIAYACGFGNLGHFSRAYAELFGELPSATLARAKGEAFRQ